MSYCQGCRSVCWWNLVSGMMDLELRPIELACNIVSYLNAGKSHFWTNVTNSKSSERKSLKCSQKLWVHRELILEINKIISNQIRKRTLWNSCKDSQHSPFVQVWSACKRGKRHQVRVDKEDLQHTSPRRGRYMGCYNRCLFLHTSIHTGGSRLSEILNARDK